MPITDGRLLGIIADPTGIIADPTGIIADRTGISVRPTASADAADGRFAAAQKPQIRSVWRESSKRPVTNNDSFVLRWMQHRASSHAGVQFSAASAASAFAFGHARATVPGAHARPGPWFGWS